MWRGPIRLLFLFLAATPPLSSSELRRPRQLYDALSIAIHITIPNPNLAGVRGNSCAIPLVAAAAGVPAPLHSSVGASSSQPLVALSHQRRTCGSLASAAPAVARTHRRLLQVGAAARTESTGVPIGFYTPLFEMADSSKQVGMDTDGGGAAAAAVDGQNLPVLVTNRKRELTLEGKALPVDCSGRRRIDLEKDLSMIGSPFTKHTSDKNGDNNEMRDVDERCTMDVDNTEMRDVVHERDARDVELGDMAAAKELEQGHMASVKEESELIKVVEVLHMVRCREITEYNLKLGRYQNLGVGHRSNRSIARNIHGWCTLNISSIKVTESDVGYPISVFGTVLARDEYDFRRDRDDPQLITSLVRVDGDVDKVFCKGVREHHADACLIRPVTLWLRSCLSTVILVYSPVESAIEACVAVNIQGVVSNFNGKVTAWTTEYHENKIVLYDSKVAGTKTVLGVDGSVELTRRFVAVELEDILVLNICVFEGEDEVEFELYLGQNDEECTLQQGPYKLQVKISWTAAMKKRWRERSMKLGRKFVLV
uniref:DUF6598 domain-containing protein n=1 Tax=Oryza glumipatula TaxID=40148 RepID=A0A0D9Z1W8_9ORYZ